MIYTVNNNHYTRVELKKINTNHRKNITNPEVVRLTHPTTRTPTKQVQGILPLPSIPRHWPQSFRQHVAHVALLRVALLRVALPSVRSTAGGLLRIRFSDGFSTCPERKTPTCVGQRPARYFFCCARPISSPITTH